VPTRDISLQCANAVTKKKKLVVRAANREKKLHGSVIITAIRLLSTLEFVRSKAQGAAD
jgi:hypothetical protein